MLLRGSDGMCLLCPWLFGGGGARTILIADYNLAPGIKLQLDVPKPVLGRAKLYSSA